MIKHAYMVGALALGLAVSPPAPAAETTQLAADNCFQVGQDVAARQGATLVGAEAAQRDGASGCRVVLLYEAQGGERPRREEIFVAQ